MAAMIKRDGFPRQFRDASADDNWRTTYMRDGREDASHRYLGSLQLFASEKTANSRSFPQSFLPARRGCLRK